MIQGREKKYSELTGFSKDITPVRDSSDYENEIKRMHCGH